MNQREMDNIKTISKDVLDRETRYIVLYYSLLYVRVYKEALETAKSQYNTLADRHAVLQDQYNKYIKENNAVINNLQENLQEARAVLKIKVFELANANSTCEVSCLYVIYS